LFYLCGCGDEHLFAGAHETSVSLDVRVYVCLCAALLAWLLFAATLRKLVDCKAVVHSWLGFGIWSFFGGYGAVGSSDRDRTKRSMFASVVILLALVISRLPGGGTL
jgi:hypothetical protein